MLSQLSQLGVAGGNTKPPRDTRSRTYICVWNNYTLDNLSQLSQWSRQICSAGVIGREVGEEGTPHLQCWFRWKDAQRWSTLHKKWPTCHWEATRGDDVSNIRYCSKDGEYEHWGCTIPEPKPDWLSRPCVVEIELRNWEIKLLDILKGIPNDRDVHWWYDEAGGCGKSTFVNWLCDRHDWIMPIDVVKSADVLTMIDEQCGAYIFDIPREQRHNVPYLAMECIKNGRTGNGKLMKNVVRKRFNSPHIVVLSNFVPDVSMLSMDRWKIIDINSIPG